MVATDVKKTIIGQTIGGLFQALFGGQPLLILLTTAPLSLYIKVIYSICEDFDLDFYAFYGCVGLWAAGFLALYSVLDVARLMHWCSRSTEEIFGLFITIAFIVDPAKETAKSNGHRRLCFPPSLLLDALETCVVVRKNNRCRWHQLFGVSLEGRVMVVAKIDNRCR